MDFVILAVIVAAGFGLAALLKANKESAFQEGLAAAERQRSRLEQKASKAVPLLAKCDQQLLYLILDIFSGRTMPEKRGSHFVPTGLPLPLPLFDGKSYSIHPELLQWLRESISGQMGLDKLPWNEFDDPWDLYERIGPIPSRTREYMEDVNDKVGEALNKVGATFEERDAEAVRIIAEACQPFMDLEKRKLEEKRNPILADVSSICGILIESSFVTIVEQLVPKYVRLVNGRPTGDLEVHYDPEHKGQTLVTYLVMQPQLGPNRYQPYDLARGRPFPSSN